MMTSTRAQAQPAVVISSAPLPCRQVASPAVGDVNVSFATVTTSQAVLTKRPGCTPSQASRLVCEPPRRSASLPRARAAGAKHTTALRSRSGRSRHSAAHEPMPVSFFAGSGDEPRFRIVCYGDSLTVGFFDGGRQYEPYGKQLAESVAASVGSRVEVIVCGQSGHTAEQMVANLDASLVKDVGNRPSKGLRRLLSEQSRKVDLAVIMTGTNDLGHDLKLQGIYEDVGRLHAACHSLGVPTVAMAPPPAPKAGAGTSFDRNRLQLINLLTAWASTTSLVRSLVKPGDLVPTTQSGAWDPDGLHFAPAGSQLLGQRLSQLIAPLLNTKRQ